MRRAMSLAVVVASALSPLAAKAAPTPRGMPIPIACAGPNVIAGRKAAAAEALKLGLDPKACFGKMQIYDGPNYQYVVVAPSKACPGGSALDVYEQSRAGAWHSLFEKPVCGSKLSIGPATKWGDWMITVDGRHYLTRGAFYVQVP